MNECRDEILISIIVPVYNVQDYIGKCIESILEQTYSNIEVIVIDDASQDGSLALCEEYQKRDDRIRLIKHSSNQGIAMVRKSGVRAATGAYIMSVDGDDWIEKDRVEAAVGQVCTTEADMLYLAGVIKDFGNKEVLCNNDVQYATYFGNEITKELFPLIIDVKKCFQAKVKGSFWSWVIKRELLQEKMELIDDRITQAEDDMGIWYCLLEARKVVLMEHAGYHYLQRMNSITQSRSENIKTIMRLWYSELKEYLKQKKCEKEIYECLNFLALRLIIFYDFDILLDAGFAYLYPYSQVKKGSRIVVYGAGKMGCHLVDGIGRNDNYEMVLWVDRNCERQPLQGKLVQSISKILETEYDYVVIAVAEAEISAEIRESLIRMGVNEEKIALIDPAVITGKNLKYILEMIED